MAFTLGHKPALDGLRGMAILLVLACHIPMLPMTGGFIGVDLFFVLSGFLITSILLEESKTTGGIRLGTFYLKRLLRLVPALVCMLLGVIVLVAFTESKAGLISMLKACGITLLYGANWFLAFEAYPREEIRSTWSLSAEEQFYLIWPVLVYGFLRLKTQKGWLIAITVALMLGSALARLLIWNATGSAWRVYCGLDTHADGLLAGSLAALLLAYGQEPTLPRGIRGMNILACVVLGVMGLWVFFGLTTRWDWHYLARGHYLVFNLGLAALVVCLATSPWLWLRLVFEWRPLIGVGRISYGIYLWHMPVFAFLGRFVGFRGAGYWALALAVSVGAAAVSYFLIEKPFLGLKKKLEKKLPVIQTESMSVGGNSVEVCPRQL